MCVSAKVPALVKLCLQALSEDKCIVIGLQSTGEARTEEAVAKYVSVLSATFLKLVFIIFISAHRCIFVVIYSSIVWQDELADFISGARELLQKFVEQNFPMIPKPVSLSGKLMFVFWDQFLMPKPKLTNFY